MRFPVRLAKRNQFSRPLLAVGIALLSTVVVLPLIFLKVDRGAEAGNVLSRFDDPLYDQAYSLRRRTDGRDSPVVIVTADQASLDAMAAEEHHYGWPWPRQYWSVAIDYLQKCGAKVAAVDMLFSEPSLYNHELDDDHTFADMLDQVKIPVIFAAMVGEDGSPNNFAPPVKRPVIRGAVNLDTGSRVRVYLSTVHGVPSLARQAVQLIGGRPPDWADAPFWLHYYGRHLYPDGQTTYPYVHISSVISAAINDPDHPRKYGIDPAMFKDKIVLMGTTATSTFDLKASPTDDIYPGVELHATAIENMLAMQRVKVVSPIGVAAITALTAIAAAAGAVSARRIWLKLLLSLLVGAALLGVVVMLFRRENMIWLPPVGPLLGMGLTVVLALSWSYFAEDRQARFFLKALGQYVSPHVAEELKADPQKLVISTEVRELTILFSDIAHFTDLSEKLGPEIGPVLNYYLDEMSEPVWKENGTVDKYIGDAIMSFWNAPLIQPHHPACACRAALAMARRLHEIQPQLAALGAPGLSARIGISTGSCTFGNMGSRSKFNYSAIGDSCNFASRLEGANKLYDTHILIGHATAQHVREQFVLRKVDVLRVKGKLQPIPVYELIGEGTPDAPTASMIARYEAAFRHYTRQEWDMAEGILLELLREFPQDGPARELLARITAFRHHPPPPDWDGVFVATEK